jgi:serine acetyltransferase
VLLAPARIGSDAIVGAAAVVDFDVPPGCVVAGNPARIVRRRP